MAPCALRLCACTAVAATLSHVGWAEGRGAPDGPLQYGMGTTPFICKEASTPDPGATDAEVVLAVAVLRGPVALPAAAAQGSVTFSIAGPPRAPSPPPSAPTPAPSTPKPAPSVSPGCPILAFDGPSWLPDPERFEAHTACSPEPRDAAALTLRLPPPLPLTRTSGHAPIRLHAPIPDGLVVRQTIEGDEMLPDTLTSSFEELRAVYAYEEGRTPCFFEDLTSEPAPAQWPPSLARVSDVVVRHGGTPWLEYEFGPPLSPSHRCSLLGPAPPLMLVSGDAGGCRVRYVVDVHSPKARQHLRFVMFEVKNTGEVPTTFGGLVAQSNDAPTEDDKVLRELRLRGCPRPGNGPLCTAWAKLDNVLDSIDGMLRLGFDHLRTSSDPGRACGEEAQFFDAVFKDEADSKAARERFDAKLARGLRVIGYELSHTLYVACILTLEQRIDALPHEAEALSLASWALKVQSNKYYLNLTPLVRQREREAASVAVRWLPADPRVTQIFFLPWLDQALAATGAAPPAGALATPPPSYRDSAAQKRSRYLDDTICLTLNTMGRKSNLQSLAPCP